MALTRDFKETVAAACRTIRPSPRPFWMRPSRCSSMASRNPAKLILRDLVNATVGFEALADEIHKPAKSLHRMLSKSGNPTMSNISASSPPSSAR